MTREARPEVSVTISVSGRRFSRNGSSGLLLNCGRYTSGTAMSSAGNPPPGRDDAANQRRAPCRFRPTSGTAATPTASRMPSLATMEPGRRRAAARPISSIIASSWAGS